MMTFSNHTRQFRVESEDINVNAIGALASLFYHLAWMQDIYKRIDEDVCRLDYGRELRLQPGIDTYLVYRELVDIATEKGATVHRIKSDPPIFAMNITGEKTAELRNNDRHFKVGDICLICEHERATDIPFSTGNVLACRINWVITEGEWLQPGYCAFGFNRGHAYIHKSHSVWTV